jgi:hypothetical protein
MCAYITIEGIRLATGLAIRGSKQQPSEPELALLVEQLPDWSLAAVSFAVQSSALEQELAWA